ncbi:hypothetical protein E4U82_00385 [Lentibacillus salicampi]|uniref:Uncharacterized protein n=2 Tax=Lentibacillus salicampi TaxID=175306 RepID=A0A4Y9AEV0_9BACI|nr:hypothetical protein E4U82_00385 [Lentibacillus salicampi]
MNMLMQREMEGDVASGFGDKAVSYMLFGIISILLTWVLGPKVTGVFDINSMNQLVSIMCLLITVSSMSSKLEEDHANRQLSFLQTLPVSKRQIVHVKFQHLLLNGCLMFVWLSVVTSVNLFISKSWTLESWIQVWGFTVYRNNGPASLFLERLSGP